MTALTQLRQVRRGLHLEALQVTLHQRAALRVGDFVEVSADDRRGVGQIPVEVAVHGGMVETGQRAIEFCHEATQAGHERGRVRLDQSQRRARQVAEQAHIVWLAIGVVDRVHGLPVERVDEAGTEVVAAVAGDVGQGAVLGVQHGGRFQGVGDFQHKLLAGGGAQLEILVALAGQRGRRAVNAKQPAAPDRRHRIR